MNRVVPPLVAVSDLSRRYPPATAALVDATFSVYPGESVAIVGPSGSGKSTLLAILGLLEEPTAGRYLLDGTDVGAIDERRRTEMRGMLLGFVFQAFHLIPHLTVGENVTFALNISGRHGSEADALAADYLTRVDLAHRADAFPATLSGGEQQRAAIARALAPQPRLLLCDEPTGNLDSTNTNVILDLLLRTLSPTSALLLVTHDAGVAARCARRLTVRDGHVSEGPR